VCEGAATFRRVSARGLLVGPRVMVHRIVAGQAAYSVVQAFDADNGYHFHAVQRSVRSVYCVVLRARFALLTMKNEDHCESWLGSTLQARSATRMQSTHNANALLAVCCSLFVR
jgi:hypothetical protein